MRVRIPFRNRKHKPEDSQARTYSLYHSIGYVLVILPLWLSPNFANVFSNTPKKPSPAPLVEQEKEYDWWIERQWDEHSDKIFPAIFGAL